MTTGKVEYAPDYKSNFKPVMDAGESITESVIAANRAAAERERLEREVIEKAKEWRELRLTHAETRHAVAALMDALDDLAYFESKQ